MKPHMYYGTVTEAVDAFRKMGFNLDLSLSENKIICSGAAYEADDIEVEDIYRYEGITDPADEAIVYALKTKAGDKGILVMGYGVSDGGSAEILSKLHARMK
jgi:hypothetical protein